MKEEASEDRSSRRKTLGKRLRFEIFKRDNFTCRYCSRKSPEVILEVDHVIPKSSSGPDDEMNLVTSCFDCNRGKSDRNLSEIITGEEPHDKALELAEKERQLAEYYAVRERVEERITNELTAIIKQFHLAGSWSPTVRSMLRDNNFFDVFEAIRISLVKLGKNSAISGPYAWGILRNWKNG